MCNARFPSPRIITYNDKKINKRAPHKRPFLFSLAARAAARAR